MSLGVASSAIYAARSKEQLKKELNEICELIDGKYFAEAKYENLRKELREKCEFEVNPDLVRIDRLLKAVKEEVVEFRKVFDQHKNVINQRTSIAKSIRDAGAIKIKEMGAKMSDRMGIRPYSAGWLSEIDEYGAESNLFSPKKSLRENIEAIKNNKSPYYASPFKNPSESVLAPFALHKIGGGYKRLLNEALNETSSEVNARSKRIRAMLDSGNPIAGEFQPYRRSQAALGISNPLSAVEQKMQKAFNWAGRGIFSSSIPEYNPHFTDYLQNRNAAVSNFIHKLNPGDTRQAELINRYKDLLSSTKFLDEDSFNELMELFKKEVESANKVSDEQMKAVDEKLEGFRKEMFETAKNHSGAEDEMWKFRLLQAFLIVSPFVGIAYMEPILGVFSSAFGADGLAQGLSSILTPEVLGPLGYVTEFLRLDELLNLLLTNVPILNNLVDLSDSIIGSSLSQGLLTAVALPLLAGPIIPIGIAGLYSVYRISSEMDHHLKYEDAFKGHNKKLDNGVWDLIKDLKDAETLKFEQAKKSIKDSIKETGLSLQDSAKLQKDLENLMQPHLSDEDIKGRKEKARELMSTYNIEKTKKANLINKVITSLDTFFEGPNFDNFVKKKFDIFRKFYEIESLVDFSARAFENEEGNPPQNALRAIVGDGIWGHLKEAEAFLENEDSLSEKNRTAFRKFLGNKDNAEIRLELEQRIMLSCSFADQGFGDMLKSVNQAMADIKSGDVARVQDALKRVAEEKIFRDQEFVLAIANEREIKYDPISSDPAARSEAIKKVEESIKAKEIEFMKETVRRESGTINRDAIKANSGIPPSSIAATSALLLNNSKGVAIPALAA